MLKILRRLARKTFLGTLVRASRDRAAIHLWQDQGKPVPPPPAYKQSVVKKYAQDFNLKTLVETGTYQGEMITAQERIFSQIYSVELDPDLYQKASAKFAASPHITVMQGDSSLKLPEILEKISGPCLFWLDAHYSGDITARGSLDTPILQELEVIFNRNNAKDVILIDDVHCFNGSNDYPTLERLENFIGEVQPDGIFNVADNIIRIHSKLAR